MGEKACWVVFAVILGCEGNKTAFREATAALGLPEHPGPYADGLYQIPEISPGGVALFDFDGDGRLDIFQAVHPPPDRPQAPAPDRLYRQGPDGPFREVPGAGGLDDPGYGNGVAIGDLENDGDLDVLVLNLGADRLYRNNGPGAGDAAFTDITAAAGIRELAWSTCAAFFDYDRDGDLDLYITHYLIDDPSRICRTGIGERRDYCGPSRFQSAPDTLLRNDGAASGLPRFTDVSAAAGIVQARSGFGVVAADFTGDGWADIYVANDMQPNQLHVNQRNGTFTDAALELGAALSGSGKEQAGMGIAVGDVNGDLALDIFVTNLAQQPNILYASTRLPSRISYRDVSGSSGLGAPSLPLTGWGCGFFDLEHDGDLDAAVVDGRVTRGPVHAAAHGSAFWNEYAEPNQLFINQGDGLFADAGPAGGDFTSGAEVTHSLAFGDLDRDGDIDLVAATVANHLRIFLNQAPAAGSHWLKVRAMTGKRDALGAIITIEAGGRPQMRPLLSAYSFSAASEPVAHFGLGTAASVERIEVAWPEGGREAFAGVPADREAVVRRGEGKILSRD